MGCNVINFSSRINEEIKLKNKKIFIGVYKTWMWYAAWFDEIKWTAGYYDKIKKHVYIDYEKSYDYAELICAFCGGVSYNRNDYVSESYYSFLIRMGESWVWYTILLRHGKNTYHPREYDGEIVFAGRTAFCNRSNGRKRQISLKWLGQGWWGSFNNGYVLLGYPGQVTK